MIATVYLASTGQITKVVSAGKIEDITCNVHDGEDWIEGNYSPNTYRIVDGKPEPLAEKPDYPAHFDYTTGQWVWDENRSWINLRSERNKKLSACDWTQVPDAPVDRQAWAEYRQALRDLPANTVDPREPVWPTKPE